MNCNRNKCVRWDVKAGCYNRVTMRSCVEKQTARSLCAMHAALLDWYARHKRDLPWRKDRDPYRVWVSEIMLQQTRVAAVQEHYLAFLEAFPTLEALARASQEQVLARWSGLGYYRRARMLHLAAIQLVRESDGMIPREAEELRKLPGIGRYTAAAIASIAFAEPVAVVDGNVERVLARLDARRHSAAVAWKRAEELLDRSCAGDWNQAMMELGATVCTPQTPQCPVCPLRAWCLCAGDPNREHSASAAAIRKAVELRRRVESTRALIERKESLYLVQRPPDAMKMAGMWELPECAAVPATPENDEVCVVRHSITNTDYRVRVLRQELRALDPQARRAGRWVRLDLLPDLPLTGLTRKILKAAGLRRGASGRSPATSLVIER
jgi:A/G-specific adenine glycosylase